MKALSVKGVEGWAALAVVLVVAYLAYKAYSAASAAVDAVETGVSTLDNNIAGALVPDANATVQSETQQELAALKAAGSPAVGSPQYNAIVSQFNPAQVVGGDGGG